MRSRNPRVSTLCLILAAGLALSCATVQGERNPGATPAGGEAVKADAPAANQKSACRARVEKEAATFERAAEAAAAILTDVPGFEECAPVQRDGKLDVDAKDRFARLFRETPDLHRLCFETECHVVDMVRLDAGVMRVKVYRWNGATQPWEKSRAGLKLSQTEGGDHYIFLKNLVLQGPPSKRFGGFVALEFSCDPGGADFPTRGDALSEHTGGLFTGRNLLSTEKVDLAGE